MSARPLVSIVIPCYNPRRDFLEEALASARAQTYQPIEIILVNDGTDSPESRELLESLRGSVTRYVEQENRGLAGARNTGFRAASGTYVYPLDADDRIEPSCIAACVDAIEARPEAAFVYTDYRVFGDARYVERLPDYNLLTLLDQNTLCYASLIRRADWEATGGYDESATMRWGYEDWDFWLGLAERERFGFHLPEVLFHYRKAGPSLYTIARAHHDELVAKIRSNHPNLYSPDGRLRVKARWAPSVCLLGADAHEAARQTLGDLHVVTSKSPHEALEASTAPAFLVPSQDRVLSRESAELAALAIWSGKRTAWLPDGSLAAARDGLIGAEGMTAPEPRPPAMGFGELPPIIERLRRHLVNAEWTSGEAWREHLVRTLGRAIPLRVKERVNRAAGRPVFDLSFYLSFQPNSVLLGGELVEPLRYMTHPARGRRRVALITPHLGPGGAESVLLELASAVDRAACEVLLIAAQSQDPRWADRWREVADHVYDLATAVPPERRIGALYSMAVNWQLDALLIQNSLAAYSVIPELRKALPGLHIADLVHAVDPEWDFVSATQPVADQVDRRVVISEAGRRRLLEAGTPETKIRLIRNGIDLDRFRAAPDRASKKILFAGRLDPVKRPLLLVEIAEELVKLRPAKDFQFAVAGDGPDGAQLRARVAELPFSFLGMVEDMPPVLAEADVVLVPSQAEGIPLIVLEAFATGRPVVCSRAGATAEAVDAETGILIDTGPQEAARFAAALHELLDDGPRRAAMGARGRLKVEAQYDRAKAQKQYRELLGELLD